MDIEHTQRKVIGYPKQAQVAGHDDKVRVVASELLEDRLTEVLQRSVLISLDGLAHQARGIGSHHATTVRLAGYHDGNLCIQRSVPDTLKQIEQRGAATADEDSKADGAIGNGGQCGQR